MTKQVALGQPTVGQRELDAIRSVFDSGWLSGAGPTCVQFEKNFASVAGVDNVLATSNCGSALHLALLALGAGPGDDVLVADYTFPATGHTVMWTGARPVFVDVRPDIWSIDTTLLSDAVTERTVGVIAVDPFGQPADYDELVEFCRARGLWLIEDAACATGASYRGRKVGEIADLTAYSFHGRKGITSGEGGALASPNDELIAHARKLHTYGISPAIARDASRELPVPSFDELGYNYRLSDVQAAIMLVQLERLPQLLAARRSVATGYAERLGDLDLVTLPTALPDRDHSWQSYVIAVDESLDRGAVATSLRQRGVGCNFGTYASHLQPLYGEQKSLPVSADLFARHIAIPMHANMTEDDIDYVADTVRSVLTDTDNRR
ncbi:DegT/DnrJ/EryC1/StrS family aminotransferase [Microbacterium sp. HA-8]|uniref:DegT/DnrJ/EryC1/StrS family aminotransferase n=1 Tax=Microbacterium sp. HA-8 TaxID=3234200 RepID=UPI0038F7AAD2